MLIYFLVKRLCVQNLNCIIKNMKSKENSRLKNKKKPNEIELWQKKRRRKKQTSKYINRMESLFISPNEHRLNVLF